MHGFPLGRVLAALLASLALVLLPQVSRAAPAGKSEVKFDTFDGVELHGTFYTGSGGSKSPCVILVHKIGGNRDQAGWDDLAKALQDKDYAVLSFDLRGHGESQNVDPSLFWRVGANVNSIVGANPRKDKITYKEFDRRYYPMLVNDLAAAKAYLDQQNNARECNSSNVIIIGAQDGADIAMLWMYSEWYRKRLTRNALGQLVPGNTLEGEDITCAVWLSASHSLAGVSATNWLKAPMRAKVPPMAFIYGKDDTQATASASTLLNHLRAIKRDPLTAALPKEGNGAGVELLKKSLGTDGNITSYLGKVLDKRAANAWTNREKGPLFPVPIWQYGFPNLSVR